MKFAEQAMKAAVLDLIEARYTKEQIIQIMETEEFEQRVKEYNQLFESLYNA